MNKLWPVMFVLLMLSPCALLEWMARQMVEPAPPTITPVETLNKALASKVSEQSLTELTYEFGSYWK